MRPLRCLLNFYKCSYRQYHSSCKISSLLKTLPERPVEVKGWVKNIRNMKEHAFVDVNDGSGPTNLQVVIAKTLNPKIRYGSSIEACGSLVKTPKGQVELQATSFSIIGNCNVEDGFPFVPRQSYPPEYIRESIHLRSRVGPFCSMLRVRHAAVREFNDYFNRKGFIQIHTPIITTNDCEGAGEVFTVKPATEPIQKDNRAAASAEFFNRKSFLSVSGQMHLEAMCHGLGNVYTFGPIFRAENSRSPLHLSEFYMLEAEESFVKSITRVTELLEDMTKVVTKNLIDSHESDIVNLGRKLTDYNWLDKPFATITFKEAIQVLSTNSSQLKSKVNANDGLTKEQELFLVKHLGSPVFVVEWPKQLKPFYMKTNDNDSSMVDAVDFLVPYVGELAGGSVRENDYERLRLKLPDDLQWYLDLRKFGGIPTAGFGLGFERYLQLLLQIHNIRDTIPFPRWTHNCAM